MHDRCLAVSLGHLPHPLNSGDMVFMSKKRSPPTVAPFWMHSKSEGKVRGANVECIDTRAAGYLFQVFKCFSRLDLNTSRP